MTERDDHTENDIALAGEYALRLMAPEEVAAFEARMNREPALRKLVAEWGEDLVSLTDSIDPVAPPKALQSQIEARLFGADNARAKSGILNWINSSFGRVAMAGALALALFIVVLPMLNAPEGPIYTAQMNAADNSLLVNASFDQAASAMTVTRTAGAAAAGRSFELWLIAKGSTTPISLGLLSTDPVAVHNVPAEFHAALATGTLAISDEPAGGSPTGLPTGAVLAAGQVAEFKA